MAEEVETPTAPTTRERCSSDRQSAPLSDPRVSLTLRRGKLADYMPPPYPNEEAARAGNGGEYPESSWMHLLTCQVVFPQTFRSSSRPDTAVLYVQQR